MELALLIIEVLQFGSLVAAAYYVAKIYRNLSPGKPSVIEQTKGIIAADIEKAKTVVKRDRPRKKESAVPLN